MMTITVHKSEVELQSFLYSVQQHYCVHMLEMIFIKSLKDVQALTLHMLSPARLARTHYMFLI